jgi:hypothetical protein
MSKLLRREDGIALVVALGITIVLGILVASMITYTSSSERSAQKSSADVQATHYAESALASAYSIIVKENSTVGGNPTVAYLLGCEGVTGPTDVNGPSNCTGTALKPKYVCVIAGCTAGADGSASIYGFFSGTNPANYPTGCTTGASGCVTVPASTWLLIATGYARNANGQIDGKETTGTVTISPLSSGAVASVWNHLFLTAPAVANTCQTTFDGNGMSLNVPLYAIGNVCFTGIVTVKEVTGGQAIDFQVGGKLVLNNASSVGDFTTTPATAITSGVVVGGCTTGTVASTTTSCTSGSYLYKATTLDTWVSTSAPSLSQADQAIDYAAFDPGPKHLCKTGVTSPGPPLAASAFDFNPAASGEPNLSGSGTSGGTFDLTPSSSYSCISQNLSQDGSPAGELTWNNSSSTVNGVPGKTLKISGSIFIDGNLQISQSALYTGTAVIEVSGTVTFNGNSTTLCAVANCVFTNWQGTSGNNSMLTFATLKPNTTAVVFTNNSQQFQGSFWTQPSSSMTFQKNGVIVEGPISVGSFDATFNNSKFMPLPIIKNMPTGAPVPPNTSASVGPLITTK